MNDSKLKAQFGGFDLEFQQIGNLWLGAILNKDGKIQFSFTKKDLQSCVISATDVIVEMHKPSLIFTIPKEQYEAWKRASLS